MEGDGKKFVEIRNGSLFYCAKDYIVPIDMNNIEEIRFEKPKAEISKSSSGGNAGVRGNAGNNPISIIPDESATIRTIVSPTHSFSHPTLSGIVMLQIVFNENGTIGDIGIVGSTDSRLNELAIEKAKELKFTPAIKGGQYVNSRKDVAFVFSTGNPGPATPFASANSSNSNVRPRSATTRSFKPLQPDNSLLLNRREVMLKWEPVQDVFAYRVKVQCSFYYTDCHESVRLSATQTTYNLPFQGEGPIRWRVVAELKDGTDITSSWGYFGYKN